MAFGFLLVAAAAVVSASSYVIQVHLNCNTKIKDSIFFFENHGACTTFPGFGSYQALCTGTKRKFARFATEDCSGEAQFQPLDVCIKLENSEGQLMAQEHSVMYKCASLPQPQYGMLESFPTGTCAAFDDGGAYSRRLGFNLNECVSSRVTQSGLYQRNVYIDDNTVQEEFYFDAQCTQPAESNSAVIPVNQCSTLLSPASRYVVVNVPVTAKPTTLQPTRKPVITKLPTAKPSKKPTSTKPSKSPTVAPTKKPSKLPTVKPTKKPTAEPTTKPSKAPSFAPTKKPSKQPTFKPSKFPTPAPTKKPTKNPTAKPTKKTA